MKAEIITIGDELLIGQVVDTNSAWMGKLLNDNGIKIGRIVSVGDDKGEIVDALKTASRRASLVLITGGLGPTKDDITKKVLCEYFDSTTVFNPQVYEDIEHLFRIRGREVSAINRLQAEVPAACTALRNKVGTAPGMWFEKEGVIYVSMPGVPYEMKYLMAEEVIPRIKVRFQPPFILHRTILTMGAGESVLSDMLEDFEAALPGAVRLAYLPSPGMVRLRLSASGEEKEISALIDRQEALLREVIGKYVFGLGEETIQEVTGRLLKSRGLTVSTAESCTGGNIAHLLTSVPGSSEWYMGSTVTYSYQSKTDLLGISPEILLAHGAVSEEVVTRMAESVRVKLGTDCSIATSGIAGPGGGTPEKPVGTVWVAVAIPGKTIARKLQLGDNRLITIQIASESGLNMLRKALLSQDL